MPTMKTLLIILPKQVKTQPRKVKIMKIKAPWGPLKGGPAGDPKTTANRGGSPLDGPTLQLHRMTFGGLN